MVNGRRIARPSGEGPELALLQVVDLPSAGLFRRVHTALLSAWRGKPPAQDTRAAFEALKANPIAWSPRARDQYIEELPARPDDEPEFWR